MWCVLLGLGVKTCWTVGLQEQGCLPQSYSTFFLDPEGVKGDTSKSKGGPGQPTTAFKRILLVILGNVHSH